MEFKLIKKQKKNNFHIKIKRFYSSKNKISLKYHSYSIKIFDVSKLRLYEMHKVYHKIQK